MNEQTKPANAKTQAAEPKKFDLAKALEEIQKLQEAVANHAKDRVPELVGEIKEIAKHSNKTLFQTMAGQFDEKDLAAELKRLAAEPDATFTIPTLFDIKEAKGNKPRTASTTTTPAEPHPEYDKFKETYKGQFIKNPTNGNIYEIDKMPGRAVSWAKEKAAEINSNPGAWDIWDMDKLKETEEGKKWLAARDKKAAEKAAAKN